MCLWYVGTRSYSNGQYDPNRVVGKIKRTNMTLWIRAPYKNNLIFLMEWLNLYWVFEIYVIYKPDPVPNK
jgi:hypothetical protein